jgi:hypothetical protein
MGQKTSSLSQTLKEGSREYEKLVGHMVAMEV